MAENSGIAWTTHTFNPWIGCTKVSPGCDHCYAEVWDRRFDPGHVARHWGPGAPRRRTKEQNWSKVRRWQRDRSAAIARGERPAPVRVFCASLADVFDNEVPTEWRTDLWHLIEDCSDLDWILVTKRVGNVRKMAPANGFGPNVIVLSTIVDQGEADRDLDKLVDLKDCSIVRWVGVSYEPALGPVDWSPSIHDLDWLIVGGESAQGSAKGRLFDTAWARMAVAQCDVVSTPIFVKQLGARCRMSRRDAAEPVTKGAAWERTGDVLGEAYGIATFRDGSGGEMSMWPADLRVRQYPRFGRAA